MRKIIFHHLAKTAGTSLITRLMQAFPNRICSARYDSELTPELMRDPDLVLYHGHFSFEKMEGFKAINPDAFAFVFLRHPVNRVLSQYYNWIDKERTRAEYNAIAERQLLPAEEVAGKLAKFEQTIFHMSLADFLDHADPDVIDVVDNHQARYLSRRAIYAANPLLGCADAIQNLSTFYDFVGLTETYDTSVNQLMMLLGETAQGSKAEIRVNTNEAQKVDGLYKEDSAAVFKIVQKNSFDLCVFHYALGRCLQDAPGNLDIQRLLRLPQMA